MAPKIVDKEAKRRHIARVASKVFGEKGFERTRMEDVARFAGVGKGTLYEYFADKEALMEDSLEVFLGDMEAAAFAALDPERSPLDNLRRLSSATVALMADMSEDYPFFLEYMLHVARTKGEFPVLRRTLHAFRQALSELLSAAAQDGDVRQDVNVEAAAAALAAWFDGAILHWVVLPQGPSLQQMGDSFFDMTLRGLLTDDARGDAA